jgi:hypothetical protein
MKFLRPSAILFLAVSLSVLSSCDKVATEPVAPLTMNGCTDQKKMGVNSASILSSSPYNVHISDLNQVGTNYTWIWTIKNNNPGNGQNGTVQDLSHWGIDLGSCVKLGDIIEAAYSSDKVNWTLFTPKFEVDKSQKCSDSKFIKFDFGTKGSIPSYYKLVITKNVTRTDTKSIYKSGNNTGCGVFTTCGFGCAKDQ